MNEALIVNVRDVTDEANMAAELRRVMQELQHRVKNMLANVMSLVNRAGREAATDRAVFETLSLRIKALSNTHKLLTQANWASTDLREVIAPELEAVYGRDRVTLKGPALTINARAALSVPRCPLTCYPRRHFIRRRATSPRSARGGRCRSATPTG